MVVCPRRVTTTSWVMLDEGRIPIIKLFLPVPESYLGRSVESFERRACSSLVGVSRAKDPVLGSPDRV